MKFYLLDKVTSLDATKIVAVKQVSLAEEYLADHFPTFPVLPGVFMLEAATQACGWILHGRSNFAKPFAVLKEAKNVKYGNFVAPGNVLTIEAEHLKDSPAGATFKVQGTVGLGEAAKTAFTARLELSYFSLAEKNPALSHLDADLLSHAKKRWNLIAPLSPAKLTL